MTHSKPRSACCDKPAKLDKTAKVAGTYFCTGCVKTCTLKKDEPKRNGFGPRTPSGERAVMVELYWQQDGKCAISGRPLLPPEHPQFHCQGSHILPKGTYPEFQTRPDNIIMILKVYHDLWEANKNKDLLVKIDKRFGPYVAKYKELHLEAQQNNRPWEQTPQTSNA